MPHPIDIQVGTRVREHRLARGMSQQELAEKIGVSFQQLQKYERATNRISCGRLWEISSALKVPLGEFFAHGLAQASDIPDGSEDLEADALPARKVLGLARHIENVTDPHVRKHLILLIEAFSKK